MFQYGEFLVAKVLLAIPHTIMRMCEVKLRTSLLPLNTVSIICSAVLPYRIPACLPFLCDYDRRKQMCAVCKVGVMSFLRE